MFFICGIKLALTKTHYFCISTIGKKKKNADGICQIHIEKFMVIAGWNPVLLLNTENKKSLQFILNFQIS